MPDAVKIIFLADGVAAVQSAFKTIKAEAKDLERIQARTARKGTAQATTGARNDNAAVERAALQQAKRLERIKERSAIEAGRIAAKQARDEIRAAQTVAKEREKLDRQILERGRHAAAEQEREIFKVAAAKARADAQALRDARKAQRTFDAGNAKTGRGVANMVGRAGRSTWGNVVGLAGTAGMIGGGAMIGSAMLDAVELQRQAALLSNSTSMPGVPGMDPKELMAMAQGTASKTGFKAGDVMTAMSNVAAKAGGPKGLNAFRGDLEDLSKTALAAGVSIEDMGGVYAAALNAGVKPGEEMRQVMRDLVAMGKEGAVEFKDLAAQLPQMAGMGKLTKEGGAGMVREMVALAQFAVQQQVSPEEARTGVKHAVGELAMKSDIIKKSGINAIDEKTGKLRSPTELIAEAMQAAYDPKRGIKFGKETKFGPGAMMSLFGERGAAISNVLLDTFMNAGKGEKGRDAVIAAVGNMRKATMSEGQRDTEYNRVMSTGAQQFAVAMEAFKAKIGELLPEFTRLLPVVLQATEGLAKLAAFAARNPFTALSGIFAAHLTKELAGAGISKMLETGIANILSNGGGGAKGNLASLGSIAITAAAVYLTATKLLDEADADAKRGGKRQYSLMSDVDNELNWKNMTPERLTKMRGTLEQLKGEKGVDEKTMATKWAAPFLMVPGLNLAAGAAMGGEYAYNKFTEQSGKAGGGSTRAELDAAIAALSAKIAAAGDTFASKVNNANITSPNAGARNDPASRAGLK